MMSSARHRYPGTQPFADDRLARKLFYGREHEVPALTHLILANRLVVLFARSGVGKTSLLNAGVADRLRTESFLPLMVRLNDPKAGPLESLYAGVRAVCEQQKIEYVEGDRTSLWHFAKSAQFWSGDTLLTPVLILDQFEELFTLHTEAQRHTFFDQLAYVVRGVRPSDVGTRAKELEAPGAVFDEAPPALRVVISMREDFLAELDEISSRIPEILSHRFRLLPLTRDAACRALIMPSTVDDPELATAPFQIGPRVRDRILDFLGQAANGSTTHQSQAFEPFELQIICHHLEEIATARQRKGMEGDVTAKTVDIGRSVKLSKSKLRRWIRSYYSTQIAAVPSLFERRHVRRLCAEFLINPLGRRVSLEESEIQRLTSVDAWTLQLLVEGRLLRRDQRATGTYYELSHDSLITPVLHSRRPLFIARLVLASVALFYASVFFIVAIAIFAAEKGTVPEAIGSAIGLALMAAVVVPFFSSGVRRFREMYLRTRGARARAARHGRRNWAMAAAHRRALNVVEATSIGFSVAAILILVGAYAFQNLLAVAAAAVYAGAAYVLRRDYSRRAALLLLAQSIVALLVSIIWVEPGRGYVVILVIDSALIAMATAAVWATFKMHWRAHSEVHAT